MFHLFPEAPMSFWLEDAFGKMLPDTVSCATVRLTSVSVMTLQTTVRSLLMVSAENVGLLAVVSHPLKLTALAEAAVLIVIVSGTWASVTVPASSEKL